MSEDKYNWTGQTPFPVNLHYDDISLTQAKTLHEQWFKEGVGVHCMCCGRMVKPYARRINTQMVRALAVLTKRNATSAEIVDISGCKAGAGNHTMLQYWGLIREIRIENEDPKWTITPKGRSWALGHSRIPKYAIVFRDHVWGFSNETVAVQDVAPFDYYELMADLGGDAED